LTGIPNIQPLLSTYNDRGHDISNDLDELSHSQFLTTVALFEGGLLVAAFLGGWLLDCPPTATLTWSFEDFGLGLRCRILKR
jgi:hypothetical protein